MYPELRGLAWPVVRHTLWNTLTDTTFSQRVAALSLQQYALYTWELSYDLLRDDVTPSDYKALTGLFDNVLGRFDSFLYTDPTFNAVANEQFGVGDGVKTDFQLVATFKNDGGPGRADIIQTPNGIPAITGTAIPHILGPSGIVSFASPPANGAVLRWTGAFYFRVRFLDDELPLDEFMNNWWHTSSPIRIGSILL